MISNEETIKIEGGYNTKIITALDTTEDDLAYEQYKHFSDDYKAVGVCRTAWANDKEIEPCGCIPNFHGSMPTKTHYITNLLYTDMLLADEGDFYCYSVTFRDLFVLVDNVCGTEVASEVKTYVKGMVVYMDVDEYLNTLIPCNIVHGIVYFISRLLCEEPPTERAIIYLHKTKSFYPDLYSDIT
ncbi:hypothetical protein MBAV_003118 [Candidatus Magnetobacterium bavaricum]|uniref:Uncharacterized protein n=1 Tax=Candidatus Magnetobacterium bavaricum TaxID=29290 RepID=A0A0F3GRV8_9BACT|nr:hypothetical protein MBAV_003118 [Candidatus Magnetobacterium bavaricum]